MSRASSQPVVHLELHTANLARALGFYAQACGWSPRRVSDPHGSYLSLDLGRSELAGGIVEGHSGRPQAALGHRRWMEKPCLARLDPREQRNSSAR